MNRIERQINQIYGSVFKKVFTSKNLKSLVAGSRTDIESALLILASSEKYTEFAEKFATELAKQGLSSQRGIWRKYYNTAKKIGHIILPPTYTEYEYKAMSKAVQNNFEMIKSIPTRMLELLNHKYTSTLIEEVAKGALPRGTFQRELAKHGNTQAKVIARTETAKLQTAILQERATSLGSVVYEWLASNDKRTRPSHRAMNDVIVFWNHEKPLLDNMRGHAGEFPNCRCTPQPILDEDELVKSFYKVYDYRNDKIITLSKRELLEAIDNDSL